MLQTETVLGFPIENTGYRDYLVVRDALEPLICRDAASSHGPQDVVALSAIVDRMDEHLDEPPSYFHDNWELHRQIAGMSSNESISGSTRRRNPWVDSAVSA